MTSKVWDGNRLMVFFICAGHGLLALRLSSSCLQHQCAVAWSCVNLGQGCSILRPWAKQAVQPSTVWWQFEEKGLLYRLQSM